MIRNDSPGSACGAVWVYLHSPPSTGRHRSTSSARTGSISVGESPGSLAFATFFYHLLSVISGCITNDVYFSSQSGVSTVTCIMHLPQSTTVSRLFSLDMKSIAGRGPITQLGSSMLT